MGALPKAKVLTLLSREMASPSPILSPVQVAVFC
jgi:hypothetical protein